MPKQHRAGHDQESHPARVAHRNLGAAFGARIATKIMAHSAKSIKEITGRPECRLDTRGRG
jgi:hypothetical protein